MFKDKFLSQKFPDDPYQFSTRDAKGHAMVLGPAPIDRWHTLIDGKMQPKPVRGELTKRPLYTGMHYLNDGFSIWNSEPDSNEKRKRVVNAMVQEDGFVVTLKRIGKDEEIFVHYHDPDCPESEHEAPKGKKRATKKGSGGEDDSDEEEEEEEPEGDGRGSQRKAKLKGNQKRKAT